MIDAEARIAELLAKSAGDVHAAAELLGIAAAYLKGREPMPDALADYLANALALTAKTPEPVDGRRIEEARIARLTDALGLVREVGRPAKYVSKNDVLRTLLTFANVIETEAEVKAALCEAYGVSTTTARTHIKEAKAVIAEGEAHIADMLKSNGLHNFVRPRDPSAN